MQFSFSAEQPNTKININTRATAGWFIFPCIDIDNGAQEKPKAFLKKASEGIYDRLKLHGT